MAVKVWVNEWEMTCCGDPFSVGSTISWRVGAVHPNHLDDILGADLAAAVQLIEGHHDDEDEEPEANGPDQLDITGTVLRIEAVRYRYEVVGREVVPIAGSGTVTEVEHADGYEAEADGVLFDGYIVEVDGTPVGRTSGSDLRFPEV